MVSSSRIYYLDLLRVFAIFLVVLVHNSHLPGSLTVTTVPSFLLFALAKTCVPLFVMVSGALLLGKQESYQTFFSKRSARILAPFIIWCLFFYFIETNGQGLLTVFLTRFWFIPLIIGLYVITPFLRIAVAGASKRDLVFLVIIWFLGVSVIPYLHNSLAFPAMMDGGVVRQVIIFSGYYLLGYLLTTYPPRFRNRLAPVCMTVLGVTAAVTATAFLKPGETLLYLEYLSPFTIISSVGIFLFASAVQVRDIPIVRVLADVSYGVIFLHALWDILLWHSTWTKYFPFVTSVGVGYDLLRTGIIFVLSAITVYLLRRTRAGRVLT